MNVLITGAGLVGANAAAVLAARGDTVTLVDVAPDEAYVRSVVGAPAVRIERCDVTDLRALATRAQGAEVVMHTAGLIGSRAQRDPHAAVGVNVGGTANAAEAAHRAGAGRLVYASTHGVYDLDAAGGGATVNETAPTAARSVYAATKLSAEHVLEAASGAYPLDVVVLRFCHLFGRGHYAAGSSGGEAFDALVRRSVAGETGRITTPLAGRSEWLYGKDAGGALARAAVCAAPARFTIVNVGSGRLTGPDDVVAAIRAVVPGARTGAASAPRQERGRPFDLGTAARVLGWAPAYTLESAVADYVAEVRAGGLTP